jgi:peptidoglycan-associated lipoprotein
VKHWIFPIFFLSFLLACKTGTLVIKDGATAYQQKKFVLATQLLEKEIASESDPAKKIEKLQLLANSFDAMNAPDGKVKAYKDLVELDANPQYQLELGLAYKHAEDFEKALETLNAYQNATYDAFYSAAHIKACETVLSYEANKSNIRISNLEALNTGAADYAPRIFSNKNLVFTSTRSGNLGDKMQPWDQEKNPDLYVATASKNSWANPQNFSEILNTDLAEGVATFTNNFEKIYFTRCSYGEIGNSYCSIYEADADGDTWYEATLVPLFSDSVNIGQPYLSKDGKRLYFSSDAPFGYGGNDIYFIIKNGDTWSEPYNAGFSINTEKEELFPSTDSKGNLYYASNGKAGFGGLDIFKAAPDKFAFGPSTVLPYPINSGADDFSIEFIKERKENDTEFVLESAVFSSTRKGGKGSDDIYMYEKLFINQYQLDLSVIEKKYADPLNSESAVLGMQPLKDVIVLMKGNESITPASGKLIFPLEANTDYKILLTKTQYFSKSIEFSTKGLANPDSLLITIFKEVALEKIFPDKEIVIPNIYYDYDKASLRAESLPVLDKLVAFFEENKALTIEIGSHTDSRGSDVYNEDLSQRRAQSVVDYLIAKGVPTSQLSAKGYGESKILNACSNGVECSEEAHQENRRTTFRVISEQGIIESGK